MPRDIYSEVTDSIVRAIEEGTEGNPCPWHSAGADELPHNVVSRKPYQGINIVTLWVSTMVAKYRHSMWGTYNQWKSLGAQVRKGEKSSVIIFYKELTREENGEEVKIPIARASRVFNVEQVDGHDLDVPDHGPIDRINNVETFVSSTGVQIANQGTVACYCPVTDHVFMPEEGRFIPSDERTEAYYGVLLHELTHWTGHNSRLDRDFSGRFGSEAYAMEELVAELGAAFLCARLSIDQSPRPDHAHYIANWLEVFKRDKKAIFTAAAKAQSAVSYLDSLQT